MRLYFIRHAQSTNNAAWEATGSNAGHQEDAELSDIGEAQVRHLTQHLRDGGYGITHLYTSPMTRAIQTALPCARALGLELRVWPDWHETGGVTARLETGERVGRPGRDRAYFQDRFPELRLPDAWAEGGWWQSRPCETREESVERARRVWRELLERHGGTRDRVAVVSHGYFHAAIMGVLLEVPSVDRFVIAAANTGISCVDHQEDGWEHVFVSFTNRIGHLPPDLVTK